jgi:hypothetical protein
VNGRATATVALLGLAAALAGGVETASADGPAITPTVTSGTAGNNGWYVSDVTVQIQVSGATDTNCPAVKTFRASSDALDCSATNGPITASLHLQFKIDKDAPTVTGSSADRSPNANGWYNAPVTVTFAGSDATSGIASCTQAVYGGPDSGSASVSGTCTDNAGNVSAGASFPLKYDSTAPSLTPAPARGPDANGWYNHPVSVAFSGSDPTSGIDSCSTASYGGPDSAGATLSGTCTDKAGNSASASFSLQYDATPPPVQATLERAPDANGWYNHPVTLNVTGSDATSGLDSCTGGTYSGPDSGSASITAVCVDKAGNTASQKVTFKYDSTPPKLSDVTVAIGNDTATLRWSASADASSVAVERTPGRNGSPHTTLYKGTARSFTDSKVKNGARYRYELAAVDQAGNVASATVTAVPRALTSPMPGKTLTHAPLLRWTPVRGAAYYNVQLFRGGHKVLSAWPVGTTLKLTRTWKFEGRSHKLGKGTYRWYVWPGVGKRKNAKYGKLLGGSSFSMK